MKLPTIFAILFRALVVGHGSCLLVFAPLSAHAAGKLNVFCWSEYIPRPVIEAFQKQSGIEVSVENYASNEEMLSKLLAGGGSYDLIQPSEYTLEALIKAGLLLPLDKGKIPGLKNLSPAFLNQPFDPGNRYSIPWMSGTVGIVVNTERVHDPVLGFGDVFQPRYKGRIVVVDDSRELLSWAMATLKIPTNEIDASTMAEVRPILAKWVPLIKVFDSDSPKTALLSGDVDLGIVWSGEGAILFRDSPKKFRWLLPREGSHRFIDNLAIPKTSRNEANAETFMEFVLRPEISKLISDAFPYTNPNLEARKLLSDAQRANPASYPPPEAEKDLEIFRDIGEISSDVDALVSALKSGAH